MVFASTCEHASSAFIFERLNNSKGPHTISVANVGSVRDLISKKMYCLFLLARAVINFFIRAASTLEIFRQLESLFY